MTANLSRDKSSVKPFYTDSHACVRHKFFVFRPMSYAKLGVRAHFPRIKD